MEEASIICKNCQNRFSGNYCNACGEKVYHEAHKKVSHLFEEAFHFLTHFDGSLLTTIKTFITAPGKLSLDYCNGVRKKYFKPIPFFMVLVVLYLIFPKFEGLNMKFSTYVNPDYNTDWFARPVARQKVKKLHIDGNELARRYDKKSPVFAKPFLFILIPLSALVLFPFFIKKRNHFFDHFVLATELNSYMIFINFLLLPLLMVVSTSVYPPSSPFFHDDGIAWIIAYCIFVIIVTKMFKRFYEHSWLWSAVKSLIFLFIYFFVIQYIYKMLLYFGIMLFM
jgi:Protein of unknown function (DUF3667)